MATVELLSHHPKAAPPDAWYSVNGVKTPRFGVKTLEDAQALRLTLLAEAEAAEAAREQRRQERQQKIDAEAIARAAAKAIATPHFSGTLTFLKLAQYKDTVPYFDEVYAEMKRLQAEADAAERDEEI